MEYNKMDTIKWNTINNKINNKIKWNTINNKNKMDTIKWIL
jgi:hypothetical protein